MSNFAWLIKLRQPIHLLVCVSLLLESAAAPIPFAPSRPAQDSAELSQQVQAPAELPGQAQAASAPRAPVPAATPEPSPSSDPLAVTPQPSRTPETPLNVSFQSGLLPPVNGDLPQPPASQANEPGQAGIQNDVIAQALTGIPLLPGWNLISIPTVMSDTSPAAVLAPIAGQFTRVYAYDGCDTADPWKLYDPANAAASDLTTIDHRIGLWIEATAAVTLPLSGSVSPTTTMQLCTGWNLPGFPVEQNRTVRSALASIDGKYTRVFGHDLADLSDPWEVYDVSAPEWANDLVMMQPGRGYWVLATADATLTLANEGARPFVEIVSPRSTPTEIPTVTFITDVIGTVRSDLLQSWTLSYRSYGETTFIPFATGVTPVDNAALDAFDPTLLLNGAYEIRLTATDYAGWSVSTSTDVVVEGQAKVGNFTISFVDLEVPLAGLPIQVIRTYDSRDKRKGDFGVGWTLSLRDVRLQENSTQGVNWQGTIVLGPILSYCIQQTRDHIVTVTLPDGKIYKFRATVAPQCQSIAPQQVVNVNYVPLPGTNARLTQLDFADSAVVIGNFPGPLQLFDQNTFNLYDPNLYRLTLQDGRAFVISQQNGLQTVTDLNGNVLTFTQNGITHSAGKSVTFTRDALGRITRITDPLGNPLTYVYNAAGDLMDFTDRENNRTTFTYNTAHYLLDIHDPLGRQPIRNEYDENGRLLSHTDAFGNEIVYTHDLDARIEIVQDRNGEQRVLEYDARGNVVRETDPLGNITVRTFDLRDNRTSETEPHVPTNISPPTTTFIYDTRDNLLSTKNPEGNLTEYAYNTRDQVLQVTDPNTKLTINTYDAKGNLTETKDALNNVTKYAYDTRGNLLTMTDALTGETNFEYNVFGNLTKEIDALGHETAYTYDANGNRLTQTRTRTTPAGTETLVTKFTYAREGKLTQTEDPDGTTTELTYNALGQQIATKDKLGRTTSYEYDELGRLIKTTFPDSTTEEMTYDREGRRLTSTDRGGRTTRFTYDKLGRLVTTTFPDDSVIKNTYDAAGRLIATTDGRGKTTTSEYDKAGRRKKVTDPLNHVMAFDYDNNGNQISFTDPNGQITSYEYDSLNRRIKTIFPDNVTTTTTYDSLGRRIEETDRAGTKTRFEYDPLGRLIKVIDALNQETTYAYDEVGNFISQTDANLHTTRFEYDALGRQTKRTLPDGKSESRTYDPAGNLKTLTDFKGFMTTYTYEQHNDRSALRRYSDGSQVSFTYTATGQRASVTDVRGVTRYTYDLRDRLVSLTYPDGRMLEYAYDENGDRIRLTATIGATVLTTTYAYDDASRLDTVTDPQDRVYDCGYDKNGNRTSLAYPNGTSTAYDYDDLNRLINLTTAGPSGMIQSYRFTLGPAGNRTRIDELGGVSRAYTYDELYRLTQETITGSSPHTNTFTYDPVGNRQTQIKTTTTGTALLGYTYDARDRLLTENATNYAWDENGTLITKSGEASYTWDFENRLIRVDKNDGTVITHAYDADGNRVQTRTTLASGPTTTTNYLVDTSGFLSQVVAETNGSGALLTYYVRGDDLLSVVRGSQTRFYHADGLGSIRRLTDESGNVTDTYTYSAFGELLNHTGSNPNAYLFAGEPLDANSGFYYNRARWMDPRVGRFTVMDIWVGSRYDAKSLHRYNYAMSDPVNTIDPTGAFGVQAIGFAIGAILGTLASVGLFSHYASVARRYIPSDAFTEAPSAAIAGFQISVTPRSLRSTGAAAGLVSHLFIAGVGGAEVLLPFKTPNRLWPYWYWGFAAGLGLSTGLSLYLGFAWNVEVREDYAGPFFCTSAPAFRVLGFPNVFSNHPVTVCGSAPTDKGPGAYSAVMALDSSIGVQSSGTDYYNLPDYMLSEPIAATTTGIMDLVEMLSP